MILSRQMVKDMIEKVKKSDSVLIKGIIPEKISYAKVHRAFQNLLKEGYSLRNKVDIFEAIGDCAEDEVSVPKLVDAIKPVVEKVDAESDK